jgi:hypothetical protein
MDAHQREVWGERGWTPTRERWGGRDRHVPCAVRMDAHQREIDRGGSQGESDRHVPCAVRIDAHAQLLAYSTPRPTGGITVGVTS